MSKTCYNLFSPVACTLPRQQTRKATGLFIKEIMKTKSPVPVLRGIPTEIRFWRHVDKSGGSTACWEWIGSKAAGYGQFNIGGNKFERAHRLAWKYTNGRIPDGMVVCHKCDNRGCCNPSHMFVGTQEDNINDYHKKRASRRGQN